LQWAEGTYQLLNHFLLPLVLAQVGQLASLGEADKQPDLAECCLKVLSSYARSLIAQVAAGSGEAAAGAATSLTRLAAACTCCHHRGVASAALACTGDLVGAALMAAQAAEPGPGAEALATSVMRSGEMICMGIVGGLLSSFPLSRLHKASTVLAELTSLAGTRYGQALAQQKGQPELQMVAGWLAAGAQGCQLPEGGFDLDLRLFRGGNQCGGSCARDNEAPTSPLSHACCVASASQGSSSPSCRAGQERCLRPPRRSSSLRGNKAWPAGG
jgi:hypothetical protein